MDTETPQSPFATESPFPPGYRPQVPRLGIIHFLVWTACVAVYLGTTRDLWLRESMPLALQVHWAARSFAAGAALGGVLLWISRRLRGIAFPACPGEYLLLAMGLTTALYLGFLVLPLIRMLVGVQDPAWNEAFWRIVPLVANGVYIVLLAWAAVRVKTPRWRLLFIGWALSAFPYLFLPFIPYFLTRMCQFATLAVDGCLVVVVLIDVARGIRYPWTHWLGVAVRLWSGFTLAALMVWQIVAGTWF